MILPVIAYGDPVLKKKAEEIEENYPNLKELIDNMFETMYASNGVGIAAPQIGKSIRLFVIDASAVAEGEDGDPSCEDFKRVFINARIVDETGEEWAFNEGCLSIPKIREDVMRKPKVRIKYVDENFKEHDEVHEGLIARVIQHEYDHIEGILFTDRINPLRKQLLKGKLRDIQKGNISTDYRMKFYKG